jgi:hypothetical protein
MNQRVVPTKQNAASLNSISKLKMFYQCMKPVAWTHPASNVVEGHWSKAAELVPGPGCANIYVLHAPKHSKVLSYEKVRKYFQSRGTGARAWPCWHWHSARTHTSIYKCLLVSAVWDIAFGHQCCVLSGIFDMRLEIKESHDAEHSKP